MTPVFCCGFDCGRLTVAGHVTALTATAPTFSTSTVRNGARSLRVNPTAQTSYATVASHGNVARKIGRIAIRFAEFPGNKQILSYDLSGNGPNVYYFENDSKIYAGVGGGAKGATGFLVTTGVWYVIDFDFNVNTSGNDTCNVQVNGTALGQATEPGISATNANTYLGITTGTDTCDIFYDDYIASETSTDYPIGDGYVNHFVPVADGTHNIAGGNDYERGTTGVDIINTTTDAYLLIDDVPLDDTTPDTDDFINQILPTTDSYSEHIFGPAPGISAPTVGPRAVEAIIGIHQAGTGTGNMEVMLNDNGTEENVYTATTVAGTTTITYKRAHFPDAPTGGAWNAAGDGGNGDFLDLRIRFGSGTVDANPDQYLDCVMIEAEFEAVVAEAPPPHQTIVNQAVQRASVY